MAEIRPDPGVLYPGPEGSALLTIDGVAAWGSASAGLDSVVVTVTNGVPMLMFDADSTPVTTEVPS